MVYTEVDLICAKYYIDKDRNEKDCIQKWDVHIGKSVICKEKNFLSGESFEFNDEFLMPNNINKSGFSEKKDNYPFFLWYFKIATSYASSPVYTTKYFVNCD